MRLIYNKITLEAQVVNNENSITVIPANVGVIQGDIDFVRTAATALGLNISEINELDMTPEMIKVYEDKAFCKTIHDKLLSSQKLTPVLEPEVYRQMVDTFKYAKEAANNGNPIHLKYELEQLPDTLPLDNWLTIKQEMIDDIDIFLS